MAMPPRLRKVVLTAHVTTSLGWLGAVLAYVVLDVTATTSRDVPVVRGAYGAMDLIVWSAIVPLALVAVLVGIVNAVGTPWGLVRHYWVVVKLVLTVVAATVLLLEAPTVSHLAREASTASDPRDLPGTLPHSIGGVVVLLTTSVLSVFKPPGVTRYGWRKQQGRRGSARPASARSDP